MGSRDEGKVAPPEPHLDVSSTKTVISVSETAPTKALLIGSPIEI